jgi:ABC-2 type transport system ATP-binding protein
VKQLFQDLCENGTTVFLSTHSLGVAETMCHRAGTTQKGKMIAVGTAEQLYSQAEHQHGALEGVFLNLTSTSGEESDQH